MQATIHPIGPHPVLRYIHRLAVFLGLIAICSGSAQGQDAGKSTAVKIGAINLMTFSPVYVAKELGYFKAEGLDVDILEVQSGNSLTSALLGGSIAASTGGYNQPHLLAQQGKTIKSLVGMDMGSIYVFVANPALNIPVDNPKAMAGALKGKRFGVASLGSTGHTIAEGLLAENGLSNKEVNFVAVGTGATALAALKAGAVDALITYEPDLTQILKSGAGKVVLDLRSTTAEKTYSRLPTSTFQATAEWIDKNPTVAAALVKAVARADKTLREDPQTSLRVLEKLYPNLSKAEVEGIYQGSRKNFKSPLTKEQDDFAQQVYLQAGQIKKTVPYDSIVATQMQSLWGM